MRAAAAACGLLVCAGVAFANGRPPATVSVAFKRGDPDSMYVGATFGLLITHDGGCTFDWICEAAIGYAGVFDPMYAIGSDGTIYASVPDGLRASRDGGCTFTTISTPNTPIGALDVGPTGDVWYGGKSTTAVNALMRSTDNGATFAASNTPAVGTLWSSVRVAPSDPSIVYATTQEVQGNDYIAHLLRSPDAGASWSELSLATISFGGFQRVRVLAIDPAKPAVMYLSSEVGANAPNGDLIYRTQDSGATLTQVVATVAPTRSVAISGDHVFVATELGGYESTDGGVSFAPLDSPTLECVGAQSDGSIIGCSMNWEPDRMAITKSHDLGASWQKVWRFNELHGPVGCPSGTEQHDTCDVGSWPSLKQQFGVTGPSCGSNAVIDGPPPQKPGCCDSGRSSNPPIIVPALVLLGLYRRRRRAVRRDGT